MIGCLRWHSVLNVRQRRKHLIPELSLIKLFCSYEQWNKYRADLSVSDVPKEVGQILSVLDGYYNQGNNNDLTIGDLANLFFATKPAERLFFEDVFKNLESNSSGVESTISLIHSIKRARLQQELSVAAYDLSVGKGSKEKFDELVGALQALESAPVSMADPHEFVTDDLETLVNEAVHTKGLRWRLGSLNRSIGSLRVGDFGFLFARPETGKTTFLASEVTYMAEQSAAMGAGPVLWLNNEEGGKKVMLRCYQGALGIDLVTLYRDIAGNKKKYMELTKGNLKLYDNASISYQSVERICAELRPSLVVIDQIDKIKGFKADRDDLQLGAIYQWARELAKRYCPVIGVCQADGSGEGVKWLTMGNVANAKTSKQAEADFMLGIGRSNDIGYQDVRYFNVSKNKLFGDEDTVPELRHGRWEVLLDANVARYKDLQ